MDLLVLGGTVFLGRHLVADALARGHRVSLFNRGLHNPDLFPEAEKLRGDRDGGLAALAGRRWDAVVDTCGYLPRLVRASAEALAGSVDHYSFVSSISVYADDRPPGPDESAPVGRLADETVETIDGETYGPLKALCEQAAEAAMPGRVLTVRPGLIVGPQDPSDRFTYWPWRVARGGTYAAPEGPAVPVQVIDARDLAAWMLDSVEAGRVGTFNATGPERFLGLGEVLDTCCVVSGTNASPAWIPPEILAREAVRPYTEMPLWVPAEALGLSMVDCRKAIAAGLRFRPLADTVRDTLDWTRTRPADQPLRAGLSPEREAALLAALSASPA